MGNLTNRILSELDPVLARSPKEVGEALGVVDKGQQTLRMQFRRMEAVGYVKRVGYGRYVLGGPLERKPTGSDVVEQALVDYLQEHGGVAKTGDIFRALEFRKGSYERVLAVRILRDSPRFSQDYGRGFWCMRPVVP